jgi:hypothetical protein
VTCSSNSCPDPSMAWSSPLTGDCYATQGKDYYVKCNGKKATLQAAVTGSDGKVYSTVAPTVTLSLTVAANVTAATRAPTRAPSSSNSTRSPASALVAGPGVKTTNAGLRSRAAPLLGAFMVVVALLALQR